MLRSVELIMQKIVIICKKCGHEFELKTEPGEARTSIQCRRCGKYAQTYKTLIESFDVYIEDLVTGDRRKVEAEEIPKVVPLRGEMRKMKEKEATQIPMFAEKPKKGEEVEEISKEFEEASIDENVERAVFIKKRVRLSPRLLLCYLYYMQKTGERISFDYFLNKMALEACDKLYGIRVAIIDLESLQAQLQQARLLFGR